MEYRKNLIALSWGDHKQCALFFDWVYPGLGEEGLIPEELFPPSTQGQLQTEKTLRDLSGRQARNLAADGLIPGAIVSPAFAESFLQKLYAFTAGQFFSKYGFSVVPVFNSYSDIESFLSEEKAGALEIVISNIELIDTSKAEWKQILEFRNDKEAKRKLCKFRLFLYENYVGKSKDYIEDHLQQKIEDYEKASKEHGFKLKDGMLLSLLESKSFLGSTSLGVFGILTGEFTITAVALAPSAIELGKIGIKIRKAKRAIQSFKDNHELAYIFEARKRIKKK